MSEITVSTWKFDTIRRIARVAPADLALPNYDYPGNVREPQNLIERGVICAGPEDLIDRAHVFRDGEALARATCFRIIHPSRS